MSVIDFCFKLMFTQSRCRHNVSVLAISRYNRYLVPSLITDFSQVSGEMNMEILLGEYI